jgi:hypothetical protein
MAEAVGEATVDVRPDFSEFRSSLDFELKRAFAGKKATIPVTTDTSQAAAKLGGLQSQLLDITKKLSGMRASIDDKAAKVQLDSLLLRADRLGNRLGNENIDLHGALSAQLALDRLNVSADKLQKKLSDKGGLNLSGWLKFAQVLGNIATLGIPALLGKLLGPLGQLPGILGSAGGGIATFAGTLVPLGAGLAVAAAAAVALVFALAPIAAALIPIGIGFAALAAIAIPELTKIWTAVGKGDKAIDKLPASQRAVAQQMGGLKDQFNQLNKAVQPEIMQVFSEALKVVKDLMPALKPLIEAAAKALAAFLKSMDSWLKSPSGQAFIHWLETQGPKDIKTFGKVLWDVAHGIGDALQFIYKWGKWLDGKLVTFFTVDIPAAFDIVKESARLTWDEVTIFALDALSAILDGFSHIPFIGHLFKTAAEDVRAQLQVMQSDARNAAANINADFQRIHGRTVGVNWVLHLPPGLPGIRAGGAPTRTAASGTQGAAAGIWLVGEQGPELAWLPQGTNVIPAGATQRIMGGLAAGTSGWNFTDAFSPSLPRFAGMVTAFANSVTAAVVRAGDAIIRRDLQQGLGLPGAPTGTFGVQRWAGVALEVLRMLGQPPGDLGTVLSQMSTESGGNPTIVNRSDINWLLGHPSVGLMQVIAGTFDAYAGPFRNVGPFEYGVSVDPLANIYAGLNYAIHRYGPGWTSVLGHGHGYDAGGWLPPGLSMAWNGTGKFERVSPPGGGVAVTLEIVGPGGGLEGMFAEMIRRYVRVRGGSVQQVFGHS